MVSKNITLRVGIDTYKTYKEYCKKRGLVVSRQFEIMIEDKLKKENE